MNDSAVYGCDKENEDSIQLSPELTTIDSVILECLDIAMYKYKKDLRNLEYAIAKIHTCIVAETAMAMNMVNA